jgi:hypothetical protein
MMNLPNWVGNSQDATNWTGIRKCSLPFESEVYQQSGWTENRDIRIFVLTKAPDACKSGEATSGNLEYYDI